MVDIFGILARTFLALAPAPAPAHIVTSIPLVATPTPIAQAGKLTADDAVTKVQAFYANINQVSAKFRQHVANATFGSDSTSDGAVYIQKPGKMRWEYVVTRKGAPVVTKLFVSNGTWLYVVEKDNLQVSKKDLSHEAMPVAISFLYGKGDLKSTFNAELDPSSSYGGKDKVVLKLTPKQPTAQYKTLVLVVNASDYHVTQSIITDSNNNTNRFEFFEPNFKAAIPAAKFEFDPKKDTPNYRLIDLDQQQQAGGPAPEAPAKK